jgi:hypothetical protein
VNKGTALLIASVKPAKGEDMPEKTIKEPTPAERMMDRAHYEKQDATADWIAGRITSAKHKLIHGRANRVIKAKGNLKP